ncbi:MAG: hypothetical protein ACW98F_17855 [Candidatus Hodarchaeales archaeon]|jgi:hypothetical protein
MNYGKYAQKSLLNLLGGTLILILFVFPLFPVSTVPTIIVYNFNISNTPSFQRLCEYEDSHCCIGTTWNVSIYVHSNSTSAVEFQFGSLESSWEGNRSFIVSPNNSYTSVYVQHLVSDNIGTWWIDYGLVNPTGNASGTFTVQKINEGYSVWVGTGHLYVSNITAWLESLSQPKSTVDTTPTTDGTTTDPTTLTTPLSLTTILLGVTVVFSRRLRKR